MPRRTNELDQLRAEIAALGAVKQVRRYPPELRQRIVSHASRRRAAGESQAAVAKSLDMSEPTLARFLSTDSAKRSAEHGPRTRRQRRRPSAPTLIPITHDAGQAEQQTVVVGTRVVETFAICDQNPEYRAKLEELMPVAIVAGEP
jgi:transposase-like protein